MIIKSVHINVDNDTTVSVRIWEGGTLSNPTGASLITSQTNIQVTKGWNEITFPDIEWTEQTLTWIGFTSDGSGQVSFTEEGD